MLVMVRVGVMEGKAGLHRLEMGADKRWPWMGARTGCGEVVGRRLDRVETWELEEGRCLWVEGTVLCRGCWEGW